MSEQKKSTVTLAHPLTVRDLITLGLDPETDAKVGAEVEVTRDQAKSLIGAGLVQVDPSDKAGVAAILDGEKATDVEPSAASGNTGGNGGTTRLTGDALDAALRKRGLPDTGSADEKRAAVVAYDNKQHENV